MMLRRSAMRCMVALALAHCTVALDNGVGLTPAMGVRMRSPDSWNSWNRFRCEGLNEALILEVAEAMVSSGLRDAGYQYVNIDDCWMEKRAADGHIVPFASKFPSGMKALGDKIHALGMKFGIYSCAGEKTCEGWPGSYGYERADAADYASWGVDYLKYDFCGFEKVQNQQSPRHYYEVMRDALNATGRPILFSMCNWGVGQPHLWGEAHGQRWVNSVGNSWRTGRDVFATWDEHSARSELMLPGFLQSLETAIEQQATYAANTGPGSFNDPDMLVVGLEGMTPYGIVEACPPHLPAGSCKKGDYVSREAWGSVGGLTLTEQRAQFSFWCVLAAPLMLGNDPRVMSMATRRILMAPELLRINQDPLAVQGTRVYHDKENKIQVWTKRLADGTHALLLFNGGLKPVDVATRWERDLPEAARPWAVDVPREPPCANKHDDKGCDDWSNGGECEKNPGFMKANCMAACNACPPAKYEGKQAAALVRDAWAQEFDGVHTAIYVAKHVESHEARVLIVAFGERDALEHRARFERERRTSDGHNGALRRGGGGGGDVDSRLERLASKTGVGSPHGLSNDGVSSLLSSMSGQEMAHGSEEGKSHVRKLVAGLEPPTRAVCMAEHSDSLLLFATVAVLLAVCVFCMLTRCSGTSGGRGGMGSAPQSPRARAGTHLHGGRSWGVRPRDMYGPKSHDV